MKIAIVAPEVFPVPPIRGGATETVIEEVSARLSEHEVHIYGISSKGLAAYERKGHRSYYRWKSNLLDKLLLSSWKLPFKQSESPLYYRPYAAWAAGRIALLNPDVIWVHSRVQFVPVLKNAAPYAKLILSIHNESNLKGDRVWNGETAESCDLITGCSRYMAQVITERRPALKAKTVPLPNGVSPELFSPYWGRMESRIQLREKHGVGERPVVLYVGRLVEEKGVHHLLEAFKKAAGGRPDPKDPRQPLLVLVGAHTFSDGRTTSYIEKLKEQAKGWEERIRFVGHVSRDEITDYFLMSDMLAFPSVWKEPFGLVILEAMATGIPVVAFQQGGPAEIIQHGVDGLLVYPEKGAEGFSEALQTLIRDPAIREEFGREARRKVEMRYSWQVMANRFIGLCGTGKPKRILIAESGSGFGGSARYLHDLLLQLDHQRYSPHVLAAEEGPFIKKIREQGVALTVRPGWRYREGISGVFQIALTVVSISRWLRRNRFKLVHLNNEILSHLPLLMAARLVGCKTVCHLHGWRPLTKMERFAVRFVDEFICISEAGAAYYREQLPGKNVIAIQNGLRLDGQFIQMEVQRAQQRQSLGLTPGDIGVAIIGRLVPWKGQEVYLRALAEVIREHFPVVGLVVGNDTQPGEPYLAKLKELVRELDIERKVRFVPWQEDIWPVYAAADLVVHASTQPEPFGLVILEAMAAKKPVVATSGGGVKDVVVNEETGLLVEPGDVKEMAEAIKRLICSPGFSAGLVNKAHYRVRNDFTMDRNAAQVMAVYEKLLKK
ncbi:MAG: glycosyltransferase family 4 protein [Candidatus Omnitrophica bacterium]|nr:glycosyltransferase family 4 protein [Candidatus Omnitrophota bacterium]